MNDLKLIMEAQCLIKNGQPLSDEHLKALLPMYKILETKLKPKDPIPFLGNLSAGFLVCSTPSGKLKGLGFIHRLLVQATNQIEESQSIPIASLYSWGVMGNKGIYLYETEPGTDFDDDDEEHVSPVQNVEWEEEVSRDMLAEMEKDKKRLEDKGETPETNPLLKFYDKQIRGRSYLGKSKPFDNDPEKIRKNVEGLIRYAIQKLIACEDTKHVGYHLNDTIIIGLDCIYIGDWRWKLF